MAEADRLKWDRKLAVDEIVLGDRPARFLAEIAQHLPTTGRALDIASGEGSATLWLAERGLHVDALDVSPVALAKVMRRARERGIDARVRPVLHDLDDGLPDPSPQYDVITVVRFYAADLMPALGAALARGGVLAVEVLTKRNLELDIKVPSARFLADVGLVRTWADGLEIASYREEMTENKVRASLAARRP